MDEPQHAPFTYRSGIESGLTPGQLRGPTLSAPCHGVRTLGPVASLSEGLRALALVIRSPWAASHVTAAHLHRLPLPPGVDCDRLHVMTAGGRPAVRRRGVVGHRGLERRRLDQVAGVPVTGAADTVLDLAAGLPLEWVVALCDAVLRRGAGAEDLDRVVGERSRDRGHRGFAQATAWMRPGVRSPMESLARVYAVWAGFPEPEVNATIRDRSGGWLGEGDLVWREQRIVAEYQGGVHRLDQRQWRRDVSRLNGLAAEGWLVVQLTYDHVRPRALLQAALREAFALRGWPSPPR